MSARQDAVLSVRSLTVPLPHRQDRRLAIEQVHLELQPAEILCLVGESGSGKSITAHAIMMLLHLSGLKAASGSIELLGRDLMRCTEDELRRLRGSQISMIFQEPMSALNPLMRVVDQIEEAIKVHSRVPRVARRERVLDLLGSVGLPDPRSLKGAYPHQLSGGQRQRVMIAMALALEPIVLIADEPTTALDVTTQAQILALIRDLQRRRQMSVLFVTHDFGIVAEIADRVAVMYDGRIVETGTAKDILERPIHAYTKRLIAAIPRPGPGSKLPVFDMRPLLRVRGLRKTYGDRPRFLGKGRSVTALCDVALDLHRGETLGVVGESGSGKSTLAKAIVRLIEPDAGEIWFGDHNLRVLTRRGLRPLRSRIQMIFQDPVGSLNPRLRIGEIICEGPIANGVTRAEATARMTRLLSLVGLESTAASRFPHEFSGGQRQRIAIARALALEPEIVIADEAVSALDVSIQAQILDLLKALQQQLNLSLIFITHDLRVAAKICDRILVMENGRVVEVGPTARVFSAPEHPYTVQLLEAIPGRSLFSTSPAADECRRSAEV